MKQLTIAAQVDYTSKQAHQESVIRIARYAIFGSKVNPAVPLRMKGLLSKAEFEKMKLWFEDIAKREAKRLARKYPFTQQRKAA